MVLSAAFTSAVNASPSWLLRPMQRLLKIPKGAESLLITGLIGGYPVGAKCISDRYRSGELSEAAAAKQPQPESAILRKGWYSKFSKTDQPISSPFR
jgi:hypothetical protein